MPIIMKIIATWFLMLVPWFLYALWEADNVMKLSDRKAGKLAAVWAVIMVLILLWAIWASI